MRIGKLNHRVKIFDDRGDKVASRGQKELVETPIAHVWAGIEPLRGQEAFLARQIHGRTVHKVTIRYFEKLKETHWIQDGKRKFHIREIRNLDEGDRFQELMCVEGE